MENNTNNNPWKGLSSYTYQDADRFYGRDQELNDIAFVIKQNTFTTLYGISGAGKTSIINAGLFPLLDKQSFLPIYIRLDHNAGHIPYDIQIINAVKNSLNSIEAESENIVGHDIESELDKLWLFFHTHRFWSKDNHVINPIIFIDQFEEIFTKNEDTNNIWSFFYIIDSLQYNTPTERILNIVEGIDQSITFGEEQNFRMVFAMREDFLARLEDYSYNIPALRKNRIGIKPLNGLQALEVILKPRPDMVTRKVALHIISKIVGRNVADNERKLEATSVDTSILSLFCTELYNYAMSDNKGEISIPLVDLYGGNILEWFYDRNMQKLPKQTYVYLENQLLTHSGFRNSVALENLLENGVLQEQLDVLAENRVIRIEDVNHSLRVEFTHDTLCRIAKKHRDEREKDERMKSEASARRAFTIDNLILFSTFTVGLLSIFYAGFDQNLIISFISVPYILFLYMVIANRPVADRNLSNTIWFIIICLALEVGLVAGIGYSEDHLKPFFTAEVIYDSITTPLLLFIPLVIILMPFAILIKIEFQHRFTFLKSMRRFTLVYIIFLLIQYVLLGISFYARRYYEYEDNGISYLPYFLVPSIILALSPIYGLYQNIKRKTSIVLSGYTFAYSLYVSLYFVTIYLYDKEYIVFNSRGSKAIEISMTIIWGTIAILCAFYAIQYTKQPKQQSFTDYYKNVLNFQAFTKYKSIKYRFHTILICYAIFIMGVISLFYVDIIPFFTLPVACVLALYAACNEFKLTTAKTAFSYKVNLPIIILSEIIVGSQYIIGNLKLGSIWGSALLITLLALSHLLYKENIHNRILFSLRVFAFSVFVGFILPLICIGYNIFNPALMSICRVWDGTISSSIQSINFMTVKNEKGEVGAMDYSEIIIKPNFQKINSECYISSDIAISVYPYRRFLMRAFNYDYESDNKTWGMPQGGIGDGDDANNMSYSNGGGVDSDNNGGYNILSFDVGTNNGGYSILGYFYFLENDNKYGRAYINEWQSTYISSQEETSYILSDNNKCLSEKDRHTAIIKLFIKELARCYDDRSFINYYVGKNPIRRYNSYKDSVGVFKQCYNEVTLNPLLNHSIELTYNQVYQAIVNSLYLFANDKDGCLEDYVFNKLWNQLNLDRQSQNSESDKAFLLLLLGKKNEAEKLASSYWTGEPIECPTINSFLNLCLSLYCNGKVPQMETEISNLKEMRPDIDIFVTTLDHVLLYDKIFYLKEYNILSTTDEERIITILSNSGIIERSIYNNIFKDLNVSFIKTGIISSQSTTSYSFSFKTTEAIIIDVEGEKRTDLDCSLYYDGYAYTLEQDDKNHITKSFLPDERRYYIINIHNRGDVTNKYLIHVYQKKDLDKDKFSD